MPTVSFSGIASGIDGDAITKAILDARRLASVPLENKVKRNEEETSALEEINTKLLTIDDTLRDFLTLAGGAIAKNAQSSNGDAVFAVASANATMASTTVEVLALARSAMASFDSRFSSIEQEIAPGLSGPANIDITVGTGENSKVLSVELDGQTSLAELVAKINEVGDGSVHASHINAGTEGNPEYLLVLNGVSTGVEKGTLSVSVSPEIAAQGVFQNPTLTQAQDALLNVTGIGQVSRSTNQVNDLIPGLSLELRQENTGPVTIQIANDAAKTAEKLAEVVTAINELIEYSNENDKIERVEGENGVSNVFGKTARTRVDDRVIESIRRAISGASSDIENSQVNILADLGVTTARDGTLEFDQGVFLEAAGKSPAAIEQILHSFADTVGSASGIVAEYTGFQGGIDRAIDANDQENERINDRLARLERTLEQQQEMMRRVFSNLESTISRMSADSDALSGILAGLSTSR